MNYYTKKFEIPYIDINKNFNATPTAILRYLQEMATIHGDMLGVGLSTIHITHIAWILLDWKVKMFKYPKWNEKISITTWPRSFQGLYAFRDYEIKSSTNEILGVATSKWLIFDIEKKRPKKATKEIIGNFQFGEKSVFDDELKKIKEPEQIDCTHKYIVKRMHIDTNGHVNNTWYLDFALEALPEIVYDKEIIDIQISYKKECRLNDELIFEYSNIGSNEHIICIKNNDLSILHTIIKVKTI